MTFIARAPGRHVLKLCRAEACQSVGADRLHAQVLAELGVGWRGTTADGRVTAEPVFCLGLCACGPAALLDDAPLARLDIEGVRAALAEAA
ncbi:MAG: NAD(P)H-dependent oxidoreductase subunit E [Rhodospirillales bacterium]